MTESDFSESLGEAHVLGSRFVNLSFYHAILLAVTRNASIS